MKPPEPTFDPDQPDLLRLPIASVERETGLGKETLRVWERRYGFPSPLRGAAGERGYSQGEVDKLRLVKRLIDAGHRPGALVALPAEALSAMCEQITAAPADAPEVEHCLDLLRSHDLSALRQRLAAFERHEGLARFVTDLVAPLTTRVGDAWMRGGLQIYAEHAYAEMVQMLLRQALGDRPPRPIDGPRVLLSTFPGEPHGLGLLMAEALMEVAGAECLSLGVQTPVWDLACAAVAYRADVVAIGFSGAMNPNHVVTGLAELRAKLPAEVLLWAGGSAPVLHRRRIAGVTPLGGLADIESAIDHWRRGHPEPGKPAT